MTPVRIGVAIKPVPRRVDVDPLTGSVTAAHHPPTLSPSDLAAIETALRLAEAWEAPGVVAATAAGPESEPALREALGMGATRAVRVRPGGGGAGHGHPGAGPAAGRTEAGHGSADAAAFVPGGPGAVRATAYALAAAFADCEVIVCGDTSVDGGTGAVPALLAAELGRAQCLGLMSVVAGKPGEVIAERRLDGGRRERARVRAPMVLSVEPGAAHPRRGALPAVLAAGTAEIEVREAPRTAPEDGGVRIRPYRPRPRALPGPDPAASPLDRVEHLVGTLADREPPRRVDADPAEAARTIADQLRSWGYL